jgi:hypothetical protein
LGEETAVIHGTTTVAISEDGIIQMQVHPLHPLHNATPIVKEEVEQEQSNLYATTPIHPHPYHSMMPNIHNSIPHHATPIATKIQIHPSLKSSDEHSSSRTSPNILEDVNFGITFNAIGMQPRSFVT